MVKEFEEKLPDVIKIVHGSSLSKMELNSLIRKSIPSLKTTQIGKFLTDNCVRSTVTGDKIKRQLVQTHQLTQYDIPADIDYDQILADNRLKDQKAHDQPTYKNEDLVLLDTPPARKCVTKVKNPPNFLVLRQQRKI